MPKEKELKFPSRRERKLLLEELLRLGVDPKLAEDENFRKYSDAIKKLDEKMDRYSQLDESRKLAQQPRQPEGPML